METARCEFHAAGLLDESPYREPGVKLIDELLSKPNRSITYDELDALIPNTEIKNKLLGRQVFAFHPSNGTISFQSRQMQRFAELKFPPKPNK